MSAVGLKRVRPQPVLIFCCVFVFWVIRLFENTPGGQNGQLGQGRAALPHSHRARTPQKAESGQDLDQRRSLVATFNRWDDLLQQVRLMSAKEQSSACFRASRDFCLIPFPFSFFFPLFLSTDNGTNQCWSDSEQCYDLFFCWLHTIQPGGEKKNKWHFREEGWSHSFWEVNIRWENTPSLHKYITLVFSSGSEATQQFEDLDKPGRGHCRTVVAQRTPASFLSWFPNKN